MDTSRADSVQKEQKWYVYLGAEYLGPLSDGEIQKLIRNKKLLASTLLWSPLQGAWIRLESMPNFSESLKLAQVEETQVAPLDSFNNIETTQEFFNVLKRKIAFKSEELTFDEGTYYEKTKRMSSKEKILVAFAVGAAFSFSVSSLLKSDLFNEAISIAELNVHSNNELKAAINQPMSIGPFAAIALVNSNPSFPYFVIASNQKDGTKLKVKIDGIAESLVGTPSFSVDSEGAVKGGLLKTQPLEGPMSGRIPLGEYRVAVSCNDCKEVIAEKVFFLGGMKDLNYDLMLKKYHSDLREQAKNELVEFRQLLETLEREFDEVNSTVEISQEQNLILSPLFGQLGAAFNRWKVKADRSEIFYADVFKQMDFLYQLIAKTNGLNLGKENSLLNVKIFSDLSVTRSYISKLKSQIRSLELLPVTANGMPRLSL